VFNGEGEIKVHISYCAGSLNIFEGTILLPMLYALNNTDEGEV